VRERESQAPDVAQALRHKEEQEPGLALRTQNPHSPCILACRQSIRALQLNAEEDAF